MKKNNRKGFTIVELVIVIAVIAILAGVLIPTFAGVTNKAKESKALQEANNVYKEVLADVMSDGVLDETSKESGIYTFTFTDGVLTAVTRSDNAYTYTVANGTITAAAKAN